MHGGVFRNSANDMRLHMYRVSQVFFIPHGIVCFIVASFIALETIGKMATQAVQFNSLGVRQTAGTLAARQKNITEVFN